MNVISLDYYLFKKQYPQEALKIEQISELFEQQRRLDLEKQLYHNATNKEVTNGVQANRLNKKETTNS